MIEADLLVDSVDFGSVAHVVENRRTICNRLSAWPRSELVAERVHVRIGANTRIAEEVPCTAKGSAAFKNRKGLLRTFCLQIVSCPDSGESCAYDEYVDMVVLHRPQDRVRT